MARIKIHLTLTGNEFDPVLVSERTGMQPTYVRTKNELLKSGRQFGHTEWGIETKCIYADELLDGLEELMNQITCDPVILKRIAEDYSSEWNLLIDVDYKDGELPIMYFPTEYISFFAAINASLAFDTIRVFEY